LLLFLGASNITPHPAEAQRSDTIVIGVAQEPDTFIGAFSGTFVSFVLLTPLFVSMVERNDQGKLVPRLVEKIPSIKDGDWEILPGRKMRITYRFKKGYTWHDGRPVTALDASWTYLMLRNPRSPTVSRFVLRKIDHMAVPDPSDPYTLTVQWSELYPLAHLGHPVYPRHVMEREYLSNPAGLRAHQQARTPVGNGPYRFVEWNPGSHVTMEAYDGFPEGRAKTRRLVWRFLLDSSALQAAVLAGQLDVTTVPNFLSTEQMAQIERRNPQITTHYLPGLNWNHILLNLENEWLRDKRVRQALAHAIDREALVRLGARPTPVAHTYLPPGHEGHHPRVAQYDYNPARARQLLIDAGFAPGPDGVLRDRNGSRLELTFMTTAGFPPRERIQLIVKDQLGAVGIEVKIDNRPASVLFGQVLRRRQFQMVLITSILSPAFLPYFFWHSNQIPAPANNLEGLNSSGWRNAENDRLLDQIAEELDTAKRVQLLRRQQELWAEELPAIPLFFSLSLHTSKKALKGIKPGVTGDILWGLEHWEWDR
jgi:peptide/nickel transport system substrate-binding protein